MSYKKFLPPRAEFIILQCVIIFWSWQESMLKAPFLPLHWTGAHWGGFVFVTFEAGYIWIIGYLFLKEKFKVKQ